jgi:predicted protein tyrosine phosphatase
MIYEIMNRHDARYASGNESAPASAIISITDVGSDENKFYPAKWIHETLHLKFDDVGEHGRNCITMEQANRIAEFALQNYGQVQRFIIHCEFGQSRSAGAAAALCEFFEGHDNGIAQDPRYFPNWTVYKYVTNALKTQSNRATLGG